MKQWLIGHAVALAVTLSITVAAYFAFTAFVPVLASRFLWTGPPIWVVMNVALLAIGLSAWSLLVQARVNLLTVETTDTKKDERERRWTNDPGMFWATFAAFIVLSVYTWYTHDLVVDGEKGLVASNRAFIYFEAPKFDPHTDPKNPNLSVWEFALGFGNSGNTPTRDMAYGLGCESDPSKIDEHFKMLDKVPFILGPKIAVRPDACTFTTPASSNPGQVVYLLASVHYRDVIDPTVPHVTEACWKIDFVIAAQVGGGMVALAAPCKTNPSHNCADDECKERD